MADVEVFELPKEIPPCTLCDEKADVLRGIETKEGHYYPLCNRHGMEADALNGGTPKRIAQMCRDSSKAPLAKPLSPYGMNEPRE